MNNNAKLTHWLMGIVAALFIGVVMFLIQGLSSDIATLRTIRESHGERIAALEAQAVANKDNILTIKADIQYIKQRVDLFLQRLPTPAL